MRLAGPGTRKHLPGLPAGGAWPAVRLRQRCAAPRMAAPPAPSSALQQPPELLNGQARIPPDVPQCPGAACTCDLLPPVRLWCAGPEGRDPDRIAGKIPEDRCHTELQAPNTAPVLPSGTNPPRYTPGRRPGKRHRGTHCPIDGACGPQAPRGRIAQGRVGLATGRVEAGEAQLPSPLVLQKVSCPRRWNPGG